MPILLTLDPVRCFESNYHGVNCWALGGTDLDDMPFALMAIIKEDRVVLIGGAAL